MAVQMSSADASAIIDSALAGDKAIIGPDPDDTIGASTGDTTPIAPPPPELTADEKKQLKEAEKLKKAQEDMLGKEEAERIQREQQEQEEREATMIGLAEKAIAGIKDAGNGASVRIASLPTPGNIGTPLTILLLFFIVLIVYNGHTRLQWIWLVLTNNAYVSGTASSASSSTSSSSTSSNTATGTGQGGPLPAPLLTFPKLAISYTGTGGDPYS